MMKKGLAPMSVEYDEKEAGAGRGELCWKGSVIFEGKKESCIWDYHAVFVDD